MKLSAPCSGPHSKSIRGQWTAILGSPGRAPSAISSMLGWVAAVNATESPSQLNPALIQRTWINASSALTAASLGMRHSFLGPGLAAPVAGIGGADFYSTRPGFTPAGMSCQRVLGTLGGVCQNADLGADPVVPCFQPGAARRGDRQDLDAGIHRARETGTRFEIKSHIGNKVDLVDEDNPGRGEHVRILQRLVLTLGHRN